MQDAHGVHCFDTFQQLLAEALEVQISERLLRAQNMVQVAVHQLHATSKTHTDCYNPNEY
jgi:hypothetical protein